MASPKSQKKSLPIPKSINKTLKKLKKKIQIENKKISQKENKNDTMASP